MSTQSGGLVSSFGLVGLSDLNKLSIKSSFSCAKDLLLILCAAFTFFFLRKTDVALSIDVSIHIRVRASTIAHLNEEYSFFTAARDLRRRIFSSTRSNIFLSLSISYVKAMPVGPAENFASCRVFSLFNRIHDNIKIVKTQTLMTTIIQTIPMLFIAPSNCVVVAESIE